MNKIKKHISLSPDIVKKVEELSKRSYVNKSSIINKILETYFKENESIDIGISI